MKYKNEKLIEEFGKPLLKPIRWISMVMFVFIIASPFIWIWGTWALAWKLGLTGIIGVVIIAWIHRGVMKDMDEKIEEAKKNLTSTTTKSKFQIRLEEMAKERGININ